MACSWFLEGVFSAQLTSWMNTKFTCENDRSVGLLARTKFVEFFFTIRTTTKNVLCLLFFFLIPGVMIPSQTIEWVNHIVMYFRTTRSRTIFLHIDAHACHASVLVSTHSQSLLVLGCVYCVAVRRSDGCTWGVLFFQFNPTNFYLN